MENFVSDGFDSSSSDNESDNESDNGEFKRSF